MLPYVSTTYNAKREEWSGPKRKDLYNVDITLGEVIYKVLTKNLNKIIQVHDVTGETMTCKELLDFARNLSKYLLIDLALKPGDVLGLYASNTTHVITVVLASFLCGTPVNALYHRFDKDTVCSIYKRTRPKVIFCDVENYEIMKSASEDLLLEAPIFLLNGQIQGAKNIRDLLEAMSFKICENLRYPCLDLHGDDTASIICSSGTTGPPKGVLVSHRALLNQEVFFGIQAHSIIFSFSTLYWISGLWTLLGTLLHGCLRIITDKPFTAEYFLEVIKRHQVTHVISNSCNITEVALYKDAGYARKCLNSIDSIYAGGATVPLITQEKMHELLGNNLERPGFVVGFGISELGGGICYNGKYLFEHKIGVEGKLMPNLTVKIINKQGESIGPNKHGEICLSSPYKWSGYFKNPEATSRALRDNWLHTGDIGFFDDEGFLHHCARDNDIFKSQNFQIYPQRIEDVIMRLQGVAEVCVFGIPDVINTHLIACAVVRADNNAGLILKAKDIDEIVKQRLGEMYHINGGVYFVDHVPKTGSGKVQRNKVLEMIQEKKSEK